MYVTIDPGTDSGWALWSTADGLLACGLGDPRSSKLHVVVSNNLDADLIHDVWIEDQVIYPRSKVPPQDVATLKGIAWRMAGRYDAVGVAVHFVAPADWKGQTPKDVCHARSWARLSANEREVVDAACRGVAPSKRHNVLDAVALGVWVRERLNLEGFRQ